MSKNLEKGINDMKVQNRNVDLLLKNIVLQNELVQKNEIMKSVMEIQSTVFDSLSAARNNPTAVEHLITVTSAQRPPPDLRSVKKVPAEFKFKLS